MSKKNGMTGAILQFSLAGILCTVFALVTVSEQKAGVLFPGVLLAYGPIVYAINLRFLNRQRTMRTVVVLNSAAAAFLFAGIFLVDGLPRANALIIMMAFVLWLTVRGAQLAVREPGFHSLILALDASAVIMVLSFGAISAMGAPLTVGLAVAAGFVSCVVGVVVARIGHVGVREWFFIGIAFCTLFFLVWVLVSWVAVPAGHGIVTLWNVFVSLVKAIANSVWSAILFLASLIGTQDSEGYLPQTPDQSVSDSVAVVEGNPIAGIVFGVIGILFLVMAVVWIVRLLGRIRVGGVSAAFPKKGVVRQRISLKKVIGKVWTRFVSKLRVRLYLLRNRNNAAGVYYGLVHKCAMGPWHKRNGETPEEFLRRLSGYARGDASLSSALDGLIPKVNGVFYGRTEDQVLVKEAGLIRRRIGVAVRRQIFQSLTKKVFAKGKAVDKRADLC